MWMMGYNESGHADFNMPDSFNGRKLRPLIPRPLVPSANNATSSVTAATPPCLNRIHGVSHDFFTQYHHLAAMAEQNKRSEFINTPQVVVSSRWNPTPEQLRALEELYRRGTRTPSAEQIQHITAQLRKYGKIEGKNVFYWFQNHKARERQKRRRQMESSVPSVQPDHEISLSSTDHQKKESLGASRTVFEVEQTKNWAPSTNCSTTLAEESVSIQRAAKAAVAATECRTDGWIQFDEEELQQRRNFVERNATWQMMQLSCPPPPSPLPPQYPHLPTHLIINTPTCSTANSNSTDNLTSSRPSRAATVRTVDQRLIKGHDLSILLTPYSSISEESGFINFNHPNHNTNVERDHGCGESQTLQLFPLRSGHANANANLEKDHAELSANFSRAQPYPFFEFLPLKN
ncbi:unnamed protein product [Prunus armeniaca]|uniref:Homeobox domain-containing protein n=1 Tax=Prunus armeniaca TaxID=36596 RepID=A0A6J5XIK6_PRUAR|nr:unnamed protein product [Prunus armeniaca]